MTNIEAPVIIDTDTLTQVVASIWETLFESQIEPDPTATIPVGPSASIAICGSWTATLVVTFDPALAVDSAAELFMMPPSELETADMHDALGEIVNIAGGNLKGLFNHDVELSLSLPVVSDSELNTKGTLHHSVCTKFTVAGLPMSWQLHYASPE